MTPNLSLSERHQRGARKMAPVAVAERRTSLDLPARLFGALVVGAALLTGATSPSPAQEAEPSGQYYIAETQTEMVQRRLTALGYELGEIDGVFGKKTAQAISDFLTERGKEPSGEVTDAFLEELAAAETEWFDPSTAEDTPRELIANIYIQPDPDFGVWSRERRDAFFTPRMIKLIEGAEAGYKKKHALDELDFNPIVPGQDYKLENLEISDGATSKERATVTVTFTNALITEGEKTFKLDYELVPASGTWLIDDIVTNGDSLAAALTALGAS